MNVRCWYVGNRVFFSANSWWCALEFCHWQRCALTQKWLKATDLCNDKYKHGDEHVSVKALFCLPCLHWETSPSSPALDSLSNCVNNDACAVWRSLSIHVFVIAIQYWVVFMSVCTHLLFCWWLVKTNFTLSRWCRLFGTENVKLSPPINQCGCSGYLYLSVPYVFPSCKGGCDCHCWNWRS